jgi:O-Antigen ligase
MKYAVFFAGLFLVVPAGALVASHSRRIRELIFASMLFSTAFIGKLDIHFVSREWYYAPTQGIEFSFVDFLCLIVLFSMFANLQRDRRRLYWPVGLSLILVYLSYCLLSICLSEPKLFGILEISKLLRGLLAFVTVAWYVRSERDVRIAILTLGCALICQGCLAIMQRYLWAFYRAQGTFHHPSPFADYCCLLAPLMLSVVVSRTTLGTRALCAMAWTLAGAAIILSITRMAIAAFAFVSIGILLVGLVTESGFRRHAVVYLACFVLMGGASLRGYDLVLSRHQGMTAAVDRGVETAGRGYWYTAALDMAKERPLGVGLNNWSYWFSAEKGNPYTSTAERGDGPREIMAHSAFALTLGELGWPGVIIFLALWCQWLWISGQHLFTRKQNLLSRIQMGCFFAVVAALLCALTEHEFRSQRFYIIFNMVLGFAVAVRHLRLTKGRERPPPSAQAMRL